MTCKLIILENVAMLNLKAEAREMWLQLTRETFQEDLIDFHRSMFA